MKKPGLLLCVLSLLLSSCEKTVSFNLENAEPVLVVDATIESGIPPMVILSTSFNYFSEISTQMLLNSFFTRHTLPYPMAPQQKS